MKNRNLAIILSLAVFIAAQALGIVHGAGKHKHHGHVCDIYLSTDQAKSAAPPSPPVLHVPGHGSFTFAPSVSIALVGKAYPSAFPRAPPATLLS